MTNTTCPLGDPSCNGGWTCALCGGHICTTWTVTFEISTGKAFHPACASKRKRS